MRKPKKLEENPTHATPGPPLAETPEDSQVVRALLERRLVSKEEVREAVQRQRDQLDNNASATIGDVLVDLGFITRTQLERLNTVSEDSGARVAQQIPGYILQKRVGAGAMAVVYRAKQVSLDRFVAIKILPKKLSKNPEFVERFYREGKAAAALNHPNIVQAFDVGEAAGFHYFVMEFVEGNTVYDELAGGKSYTETEAITIIRQVAEALLHAHDKGIIHRDVKPKNIMLTRDRIAKLADMGLARAASDRELAMAEAGRAYGTPYYISPEQIRGEVNIDQRADIYSLGATFYHMVTGRVPFEGPTPSVVMHKHLKETLTPPDHLNRKLTAGCAAAIEMMMAKRAADRYPNIRTVIEDLDRLLRGQPPVYAQHSFTDDIVNQLSSGKAEPTVAPVVIKKGPPTGLLVGLGIGAAVSLLVNIILIAMLTSK